MSHRHGSGVAARGLRAASWMAAGATHPWHLSGEWLRQLLERVRRGVSEHEVGLAAGAMAYSAILAVFPALVAAVSIYGLVTTPEAAARQVASMSHGVPDATRQLMLGFLQTLASTPRQKLGGGLAVGVALALWSASSGTATLVKAVSIACDEREARGAVRQRALALGLTLGAVALTVVALFFITALPALASHASGGVRALVLVMRWIALAVLAWLALSALYRIVPRRTKPSFEAASLGSTVATLSWIGASLLFALFVKHFGRFGATYGPLAGVIVLLIWLYVSSFVVLLGAEIIAASRT